MTHFAGITKATMNPTHLNYHHLRLFWEVARAGSLRAASARLHLSQPTISAQIKALEKSLEEQLFDRTGRGLKLTPGGRLVMECAAEFFRSARRWCARCLNWSLGGSSSLRCVLFRICSSPA